MRQIYLITYLLAQHLQQWIIKAALGSLWTAFTKGNANVMFTACYRIIFICAFVCFLWNSIWQQIWWSCDLTVNIHIILPVYSYWLYSNKERPYSQVQGILISILWALINSLWLSNTNRDLVLKAQRAAGSSPLSWQTLYLLYWLLIHRLSSILPQLTLCMCTVSSIDFTSRCSFSSDEAKIVMSSEGKTLDRIYREKPL